MKFLTYKKSLCKRIYTIDVCSGNKVLANNMFNFESCKRPVMGIADLLYLVATAPTKLFLKRRIENYKGYSRFLEQNKNKVLRYLS